MNSLLGFFVAMSVTAALIPPLIRYANSGHLLDQPDERKVHRVPVPRVGGIAMAAGLLLGLALTLWGHVDRTVAAYTAGLIVLLVFGVLDDRHSLRAATKFLGQALAVIIVMVWGGVSVASITLADRLMLPWWVADPLTFLFLVGATNAVNLSDGLDGLAGGTSLLCLGALALLAYVSGNAMVTIAALVAAGAVLGFLRFNTHPANVFMGDSGSQILGFSAAVLAVILTQDTAAPLSAALPLLLMGLPIIDTLMVMSDRLAAGKSPFLADRNHIHHRLLELGLSHGEAVTALYLGQALLFLAAWTLRYHSDVDILLVFIAVSVVVLVPLRYARARKWQLRPRVSRSESWPRIERLVSWWREPQHLFRWSYWGAAVLAAAYALAVQWRSPIVARDAGQLAAAAGVLLLASLVVRWRRLEGALADKLGLYVCAVLLAYLAQGEAAASADLRLVEWCLLPALALTTALRFGLSYNRRLQLTTLDVLIAVITLLVSVLAGPLLRPAYPIGSILLRSFLLFYALEALIQGAGRHWRWLSLAGVACLAGVFALSA
jgi:UDP-GlcNAc:undecaprenyl-phosphate GlcNAc-1-phosphate transferase